MPSVSSSSTTAVGAITRASAISGSADCPMRRLPASWPRPKPPAIPGRMVGNNRRRRPTMTTVLPVDPAAPDPAAITAAAEVLRRGGLVAFPTETVYGLGANALDADAVARVFAAKGRPAV